MTLRRIASFACLTGLILLAGCAKKGPEIAEVEGVLKLNGKPLDKIQVEFLPETNGPRSFGKTDSEGRFTLVTDNGKTKGAVVGSHKVVLHDLWVIGDKVVGRRGENMDLSQGRKSRISLQFADAVKTPLKATVKSGKNDIPLDAGSAGPVEGGR